MRAPLQPIALETVLDDPSLVARLARANAPYFPVQRYFATAAEMNALSDTRQGNRGTMVVGPVFRGDWAYDAPLVDGLEPIFENPRLAAAASRLFDATIVRPLEGFSQFLWRGIDALIDGLLALLGYVVAAIGDLLRFFQTGNVRNYALMFFLGVIVFIWVLA